MVIALTLFIETIPPLFGSLAIFCMPTIPGPEIKNPKTSLYPELLGGANSGYSSEPNTYLNLTVSEKGIKSNSKIAALYVGVLPIRLESNPDPPILLSIPQLGRLFGPCGPEPLFNTVPVVITSPWFIPRFVPAAVNEPMAALLPLNMIFETVTPCPNNTF